MNEDNLTLDFIDEATSNSELGWALSNELEYTDSGPVNGHEPAVALARGAAEHNILLESARTLAQLGIKVFPVHSIDADGVCSCGCSQAGCATRGKHPRIGKWQTDATTDEHTLCSWWGQWPNANIGVAAGASGLVVVDIDPRNGGDESWAKLLDDLSESEPATASVVTGGGGRHLYFRKEEGVAFASSSGRLGSGVDIKSDGGFVVAPPSMHTSGRSYEWDGTYTPTETPIAKAPSWLSDRAKSPMERPVSVGETGAAAKASEGSRNSTLFKNASAWRGENITKEAAERRALTFAREACDPPLDASEALRVVENVYSRYEANELRQPKRFEFIVTQADQLTGGSSPQWLVEDLLPAAELVTLYAQPGAGKSFWALDVACHIASGQDWGGRGTLEGTVVYLALEGWNAWNARVDAWKLSHGVTQLPKLVFINSPASNLRDRDWVDGFIGELAQLSEKPVLVVVDTFARAFGAGEENASETMGAAIVGCDRIRTATGATVVAVHHPAKSQGADSPRGHGALAGSSSTVIRLHSDRRTGLRSLECEKQRDGANFASIPFRLIPVGGSCVVELVTVASTSASGATRQADLTSAAIKDAISASPSGVRHGELVEAAEAIGASKSTANRVLTEMVGKSVRKDGFLYFANEELPIAS